MPSKEFYNHLTLLLGKQKLYFDIPTLTILKLYLQNLIPRLQQFSKSLDKKELFVDKSWVLIDEENDRHQYIFERDGNLIMSFNGQVIQGSWRYIAASDALLLNRRVDEVLLKSAFVDNGIMLLRMDNYDNTTPLILVNEAVIPDLDIERHLSNIIIQNLHLKSFSYSGSTYYYSDPNDTGININTVFYDERFNKTNNSFKIVRGDGEYQVQNGVVAGFFYIINLNTDKGIIKVKSHYQDISEGDVVYLDNSIASNGSYKLYRYKNYKSIYVISGSIYSIEKQNEYSPLFFLLILVSLFIVGVLAVSHSLNLSPRNTSTIDSSVTTDTSILTHSTDKGNELSTDNQKEKITIDTIQPNLNKPEKVAETRKIAKDANYYSRVEKEAQFPRGPEGWRKYLERNLDANVAANDGAPAGNYTVKVQFIVDKTGAISDVKAVEIPEACPSCGPEAVRVIEKGPKWEPAVQNGRNVIYQAIQFVTLQVAEE
jgi:hypothetical protein